ncbi:MAG TPA: hydrogenase maturation protease [Acetobacteraceae bacterium]|nr:hydrogenase maturation protease [Acetobacteraceae bacterium]
MGTAADSDCTHPSPQPPPARGGGALTCSSRSPLILGLGNRDRGDDGVGHLVVRLVRGHVPPHVLVEGQHGTAMEVIERLRGTDSATLVDAAVTGALPGTIHVFDCTIADIPATKPGASSHGLGVAEAIAMARVLDSLPRVCRLYAIEGVNFAPGAEISPAVRAAAEELAATLISGFMS